MAHEIDFSNGRANMAYAGKAPWHGLGFNLSDAADLDIWRKAAGLNWSAEETPAFYRDPARAGYLRTARDHKVLLRSDTRAPLSIGWGPRRAACQDLAHRQVRCKDRAPAAVHRHLVLGGILDEGETVGRHPDG